MHHQNKPLELNQRVYYEDTDAAGVVYYANYLKFFERGRTEWLRSLNYDHTEFLNNDRIVFVVRAVEIQYKKPAVLDDLICIKTSVSEIKNASITFKQSVHRGDDLLSYGDVVVCCVNADTIRPTPIPPKIRELFENN